MPVTQTGVPLTTFQVQLTENGLLPGQLQLLQSGSGTLTPAARARIRFVQNGRIVADAVADQSGHFAAQNLPPGVYSVIATGVGGLAAFGLHVLPAAIGGTAPRTYEHETAPQARDSRTSRGLQITALTGRDADVVRTLAAQREAAPASAAPAVASQPVSLSASQPSMFPAPFLPVAPDGTVSGQWMRLDPATGQPLPTGNVTVYFLQGGQVRAQARAEQDGVFHARGLAPGNYSVVARGTGGFAAFGISLVSSGTVLGTPTGTYFDQPVGD